MRNKQKIMLYKRYDDGQLGTPLVSDYETEYGRNGLADPDEQVISEEKIRIEFTYPLSVKVVLDFENKGGFTKMDLFRCVYEGYKKIYDEEEAEAGDPGTYERLYNRRKSEGKYGIWGHYMNELFLELLFYDKDTHIITLAIGS